MAGYAHCTHCSSPAAMRLILMTVEAAVRHLWDLSSDHKAHLDGVGDEGARAVLMSPTAR